MVTNLKLDKEAFLEIGYEIKGEYNIPFRIFCSKRDEKIKVNLHVFRENDPAIELNLNFRDYLKNNRQIKEEYQLLKKRLANLEASARKNDNIGLLNNYNLGKNEFITRVIKDSGFDGLCLRFCAHYKEEEAAKELADDESLNFHDPLQKYFVLYKGSEIIGYANMDIEESRAILNKIVISSQYNKLNFKEYLAQKCREWVEFNNLILCCEQVI